jgi:hypothetical protein
LVLHRVSRVAALACTGLLLITLVGCGPAYSASDFAAHRARYDTAAKAVSRSIPASASEWSDVALGAADADLSVGGKALLIRVGSRSFVFFSRRVDAPNFDSGYLCALDGGRPDAVLVGDTAHQLAPGWWMGQLDERFLAEVTVGLRGPG